MAELKHRLRALRQAAVSILSRLRGKPAPLSESHSSASVESKPPDGVDLPPFPSPVATSLLSVGRPIAPDQTPPSKTALVPPVSGAAFEAVPLPLPAVIGPDIRPPAPVSRKEERVKTKNPLLVVYGLGHFRVYCDDQLITTWRSKKGKSIFKYILAQRDHQATKDILMSVFWPDASPEAARNNLNVAVHGLRQAFKSVRWNCRLIVHEEGHYVINPDIELWVDFDQFSRHYESALELEKKGNFTQAQSEYEKACSLYQGDFLGEDLYDDWTMLMRERLRSAYMDVLDRLSRIHFNGAHYPECMAVCELILSRDKCREDAHRLLMRCYSRQEHVPLALRQYQACVEALRKELDVAPMPTTTQLYELIRRGKHV